MSEKKRVILTTAVALASALGAEEANSTTITISVNQLLSNGSSVSGAFDLSSYLNSGGTTYQVVDAQIAAYGFSDAQYNQTSYGPQSTQVTGYYVAGYYAATGYYYYSCGWGSSCSGSYTYYVAYYGTNQNSYQDVNKTDSIIDTLGLKVGLQTQTGSDPSNGPAYAAYQYVGSSNSGYVNTTYYQRDVTSGYFGALGANLNLDTAYLASINSSESVPFLIQDVTGQFQAQDVTLSFDTVGVNLTAGVPEPATF
jgi:hypothetical protein